MAKRKTSPTNELAVWFVREFLGTSFDYRSNVHKRQLARARDLVNPKEDKVTGEKPRAYTVEEVKKALIALRDGTTTATDFTPFARWPGWTGAGEIRSLGVLFAPRGNVTFIEALLEVPDPPPPYRTQEHAEWVSAHGAEGLRQGKWDGVFLWLLSEDPVTCRRMTYAELTDIVGKELADRSLDKWQRAKKANLKKAEA